MVHCAWPPGAVDPIPSQLGVPCKLEDGKWISGSSQWLTRSQCDVWHFISFTRRFSGGMLGVISILNCAVSGHIPPPSSFYSSSYSYWLQCELHMRSRPIMHCLAGVGALVISTVSEQTKHTGFPFCVMKKYWSVHLSWNTRRSPSIFLCFDKDISNLTRSTEKNIFMGERQTNIRESSSLDD